MSQTGMSGTREGWGACALMFGQEVVLQSFSSRRCSLRGALFVLCWQRSSWFNRLGDLVKTAR